ncbi:hypothetical protein ACTFIR_009637 [Dictyostelium discoideum]
MSSYADIVKEDSAQVHLDPASALFIKNFSTKTDHFTKLSTGVQDIDDYCKMLLSATNLSAFEKNNGFYPISLEYPNSSQINLTEIRKKLTEYDIPFDKIFIHLHFGFIFHFLISLFYIFFIKSMFKLKSWNYMSAHFI